MKTRPASMVWLLGLAGLLILSVVVLPGVAVADPRAPEFVFFFSANSKFEGQAVPVGAVIEAFDTSGVKCGGTIVTTRGQFSSFGCQRDDPGTPEDEGPDPGEVIVFKINGVPATATPIELNFNPVPPNTPITWSGFGDIWEVELSAGAAPTPAPPTPTPTPTPVVVRAVGGYGEPLSTQALLAPLMVLGAAAILAGIGMVVVVRQRMRSG